MEFVLQNNTQGNICVEIGEKVYTIKGFESVASDSAKSDISLKAYIPQFSVLKSFLFKSVIYKYQLNLLSVYNINIMKDGAIIVFNKEVVKGNNRDEYTFLKASGSDMQIKSVCFNVGDEEFVKAKLLKSKNDIKKAGKLYAVLEFIKEALGFVLSMAIIYFIINIFAEKSTAISVTNIIGVILLSISVLVALIWGVFMKKYKKKKEKKSKITKYKDSLSLLNPDYIYQVVKVRFI